MSATPLARFVLLAPLVLGACEDDPWAIEPPIKVVLQLSRSGARVPREQLPLAGTDGLRLFHRIDVFRPRDFEPRSHRRTRECLPRENAAEAADKASACHALAEDDQGKPIDAQAFQPPRWASAIIDKRGGVLETMHTSLPGVPILYEVDASGPLLAQVTFSGEERYWARYWGRCDGCMGLIWIEARLGTDSWCTQPTFLAQAPEQLHQITLALDLDRPELRRDPRADAASNAVACGDTSWFEAVFGSSVLRYRPR